MAYVEVEIDIEDFDTTDLIDELETRGYSCVKTGADKESLEAFKTIDLDRIEHLSLCGQTAAARLELFSMVHVAIGCDLTH